MQKYMFRQLLLMIPTLFIIATIVFFLVQVTGDPVALLLPETATDEDKLVLTQALGLDRPIFVQYLIFLNHLLHGNFGQSYHFSEPALSVVLERMPASFELAVVSMLVALVISVPLGTFAAIKKSTFWDFGISGVSVLGKAMPNFWIGIMLILLFSVNLQLFPVSGRGTLNHLVLPAITLGAAMAAEMTRLIRASLLDIMQEDYILTARSKGLREWTVIFKHVFRNGLIPVVTVMGLQLPQLIGGALIVETVFAWPGLGQLMLSAMNSRDMAIVQAATFVVAVLVIVVNFIVDLTYRLLDPRIKYH
ncbi:ABC transporter permease [Paenibacillus hodogayensis]|uniref:ABC transporter permease n=1 Tax=Paenibacillus hodogayensis TaxID=279208 RepID=A0ABV5W7F7_9BACL